MVRTKKVNYPVKYGDTLRLATDQVVNSHNHILQPDPEKESLQAQNDWEEAETHEDEGNDGYPNLETDTRDFNLEREIVHKIYRNKTKIHHIWMLLTFSPNDALFGQMEVPCLNSSTILSDYHTSWQFTCWHATHTGQSVIHRHGGELLPFFCSTDFRSPAFNSWYQNISQLWYCSQWWCWPLWISMDVLGAYKQQLLPSWRRPLFGKSNVLGGGSENLCRERGLLDWDRKWGGASTADR